MPFPNDGHLTAEQRFFNQCLSSVRARVEHFFGWSSALWRRLIFLPSTNLDYAVDHVSASIVLYNFKITHGEPIIRVSNYEGRSLSSSLYSDLLGSVWSVCFFQAGGGEDCIIADGPANPVVNVGNPHQHDHNDHILDPHVPQGRNAAALVAAHLRGQQKRWDLCNRLNEWVCSHNRNLWRHPSMLASMSSVLILLDAKHYFHERFPVMYCMVVARKLGFTCTFFSSSHNILTIMEKW